MLATPDHPPRFFFFFANHELNRTKIEPRKSPYFLPFPLLTISTFLFIICSYFSLFSNPARRKDEIRRCERSEHDFLANHELNRTKIGPRKSPYFLSFPLFTISTFLIIICSYFSLFSKTVRWKDKIWRCERSEHDFLVNHELNRTNIRPRKTPYFLSFPLFTISAFLIIIVSYFSLFSKIP